MKTALLQNDGGRTYVLVADRGEDAFEMLTDFARRERISAAQFTGIGAFARATVGWFDREAKQYREIPVDEQCEVLSLLGDVAVADDGPQVHAHLVVGLSDGTTRGGHLLRGEVWPTLEVVLRETPATLRKTSHPELGLALIDPPRTTP
ncbi:MAG TPA: PPC domain-containing DNA-binding protein [Pseudonocardiaceae bacterium]|nr:PPC domain-containing DNA-binding protein [Pseudonocardiaceae bacterium]